MTFLSSILKAKWAILRLLIAAFILWAVAADSAARLARLQLASLPDFDYTHEVQRLREEGRFGEAVMVADAGLAQFDTTSEAQLQSPARAALLSERQKAVDAASSWLRRAKDVGLGALSGRGESIEGLLGAVTADLFIVGDVRDLVIQGTKFTVDGEADPVIVALSAVGIATTLAPEIDWAPSILKIARKSGAMSRRLGESILELTKARKAGTVEKVLGDVAVIAEKSSPAGALRILRHADQTEDIAKLATFVRTEKSGAFVLHVTGREGADLIKSAAKGTEKSAALALAAAARKGPAGAAWLRTSGRALVNPHPIIGIVKAVYKGNAAALATRIAERLDPHGWWITPLLGAWVFLEGCWLFARFAPRWANTRVAGVPQVS